VLSGFVFVPASCLMPLKTDPILLCTRSFSTSSVMLFRYNSRSAFALALKIPCKRFLSAWLFWRLASALRSITSLEWPFDVKRSECLRWTSTCTYGLIMIDIQELTLYTGFRGPQLILRGAGSDSVVFLRHCALYKFTYLNYLLNTYFLTLNFSFKHCL